MCEHTFDIIVLNREQTFVFVRGSGVSVFGIHMKKAHLEKDVKQFQQRFATEAACMRALMAARWPDGFCCPRCRGRRAYPIPSRRLFQCAACKYQASLTAGTVFENTRTPLTKWFLAMFLISRWEGITAVELRRWIGVTYKTAWSMLSKLRYAMSRKCSRTLLDGIVRLKTVTYTLNLPWSPTRAYSSVIGASLNEQGEPVRIHIERLPDSKPHAQHGEMYSLPELRQAIASFQQRHVSPDAEDVQVSIKPFEKPRFHVLRLVAHSAARWVQETFHGIAGKHLQAYLHEYCYRFNHQPENSIEIGWKCTVKDGNDTDQHGNRAVEEGNRPERHGNRTVEHGTRAVFDALLRLCVTLSPLTYADIVSGRAKLVSQAAVH